MYTIRWKCYMRLGSNEPFTSKVILIETSAKTIKEAESKLVEIIVDLESGNYRLIEYVIKSIVQI